MRGGDRSDIFEAWSSGGTSLCSVPIQPSGGRGVPNLIFMLHATHNFVLAVLPHTHPLPHPTTFAHALYVFEVIR